MTFISLPGDTPHIETALRPSELITAVELPPLAFASSSLYRKVRDRASYAFALVSVAAALEIEGGRIRNVRLALGGVAPKPWRAFEAERVLAGAEATRRIVPSRGGRGACRREGLSRQSLQNRAGETNDRERVERTGGAGRRSNERDGQRHRDDRAGTCRIGSAIRCWITTGTSANRIIAWMAVAKVTGQARFTAEFDFPNLAHAALVYSTIAKGRIRNIDTERAKRAPGVLEVLTYRNMPRMKAPPLVDMTNLKKGMAASDLPILQDESVHWDGQPVAVVVAETLEQAEHAASLVEVEYEIEQPAVSFDGTKGQAERPPDVMGEPAVVEGGERRKRIARGGRESRPRLPHAAVQPQRHRAARHDCFLERRRDACGVRFFAIGQHRERIPWRRFSGSIRKKYRWSRHLWAADSAARAGCGTTRRCAPPPRR